MIDIMPSPAPILSDAERWSAVVRRDESLAGVFVYGVRTTGIYCRAGCPARRPARENVTFFPLPAAAEAAGFRACRRCHPRRALRRHPHLVLVEDVCRLLDEADGQRMTLRELGRRLHASPAHLQRVFTRVTGVSPRAWADAARERRLRDALRAGTPVSRALYDAGYSSPSRVYERRGEAIGMTPATYRAGGAGARIAWSTAASPLGRVLVGATARGICFVALGRSDRELVQQLEREFPRAERLKGGREMDRYLTAVVAGTDGRAPSEHLPLDMRVTAFQRMVYEELRRVPAGETLSYAELARRVGRASAVRAVASAVARNNVAVIIPCHRVVRSDGAAGGYRWGEDRKRRLLEAERR